VTVRAMAVGDGSAGVGTAQPVGVNTRAHARETPRSVTDRDRVREHRPGRIRRIARVMWLDAADSWIVREHSPAPATVWNTDYHLTNPHPAYVRWCHLWRPIGTTAGAALDGLKVLLIHPVRGPLTVSAAAVIYEIATH
jgi:hypothetical protein